MAELQDPLASPATSPQTPPKRTRVIGKIGNFFAAPFVVIGRLVCGRSKVDEVVVFSAPSAFFLWIVIAVGFGLRMLVPTFVSERVGGWVFIFTLLYFILA